MLQIQTVKKRGRGRPTAYHPDLCQAVARLRSLGFGKVDIAEKLGVTSTTLKNWRERYPDFAEAFERKAIKSSKAKPQTDRPAKARAALYDPEGFEGRLARVEAALGLLEVTAATQARRKAISKVFDELDMEIAATEETADA